MTTIIMTTITTMTQKRKQRWMNTSGCLCGVRSWRVRQCVMPCARLTPATQRRTRRIIPPMLDAEYQTMTETAERSTIVVADRFPFRYLAEDYGLTYYAAFPGCSAETEASFETIVFLSDKVKSLGLSCVLTMEGSNHSLAKTILENAGTDGSILTLQSLQAVSQSEIDQGATYLSKMQENYSVLEKALNEGSRETWHN